MIINYLKNAVKIFGGSLLCLMLPITIYDFGFLLYILVFMAVCVPYSLITAFIAVKFENTAAYKKNKIFWLICLGYLPYLAGVLYVIITTFCQTGKMQCFI